LLAAFLRYAFVEIFFGEWLMIYRTRHIDGRSLGSYMSHCMYACIYAYIRMYTYMRT